MAVRCVAAHRASISAATARELGSVVEYSRPTLLNSLYAAMALTWVSVGTTCTAPVTLRPCCVRDGTMPAATGALTRAKTTGMLPTRPDGSGSCQVPATPRVTGVPQV